MLVMVTSSVLWSGGNNSGGSTNSAGASISSRTYNPPSLTLWIPTVLFCFALRYPTKWGLRTTPIIAVNWSVLNFAYCPYIIYLRLVVICSGVNDGRMSYSLPVKASYPKPCQLVRNCKRVGTGYQSLLQLLRDGYVVAYTVISYRHWWCYEIVCFSFVYSTCFELTRLGLGHTDDVGFWIIQPMILPG